MDVDGALAERPRSPTWSSGPAAFIHGFRGALLADGGSEGGAKTAAILFSLTGSCRLHELDPWATLVDVLGRINDHPGHRAGELVPAVWAGK